MFYFYNLESPESRRNKQYTNIHVITLILLGLQNPSRFCILFFYFFFLFLSVCLCVCVIIFLFQGCPFNYFLNYSLDLFFFCFFSFGLFFFCVRVYVSLIRCRNDCHFHVCVWCVVLIIISVLYGRDSHIHHRFTTGFIRGFYEKKITKGQRQHTQTHTHTRMNCNNLSLPFSFMFGFVSYFWFVVSKFPSIFPGKLGQTRVLLNI